MALTEREIHSKVAELMRYAFNDIDWTFNNLTVDEQRIVGSQEEFDEIEEWVDLHR